MTVLRQGSTGTDVITLQKALTAAGFSTTADGVFGAATLTSVEAFQKAKGLGVDGIVGAQTWAALGVKPSSNAEIKGVDVSHYETGFDFVRGKKDGIVFMMTKASEGIGADVTCVSECAKAAAAGILYRGVYHFFHTSLAIASQVAEFMAEFKKCNVNMPPILDLEESSVNGHTYATVKEAALEWLVAAEEASGKVPILYIDMNMLNLTGVNSDSRFNKYPRWIAKYSTAAPTVAWTFWQFTDGTVLPGEQKVDTDWFHGSEDDLKKFLGIA